MTTREARPRAISIGVEREPQIWEPTELPAPLEVPEAPQEPAVAPERVEVPA